jgi:hypothetical protein
MYRTAPLALLSLLGAALVPATALAAGLTFTWDAPPECPTAEAVERRLTQLLADAGRPSPPEGAVRVVVTPGQTRHSARVSLQLGADPPSVRLLSAPSCAELADAATLAVALALTAPEAPRPAPEPATSPPPVAPDRPAERPLPAPAASPPIARLHLSLRGAAGLDAATLPAASPGGSLGLALSLGPAEVELSALGLFTQTAERASPPGTGAEVSLFAGRARGCLSPEIAPLHLRPCLGLELGRLQAEGLGVPAPTSGSGRWLAPELALGVGGRLFPALSLGLEVSALFPLARDHFVLEGIGDVYRAPAFSARAAFTVEARVF